MDKEQEDLFIFLRDRLKRLARLIITEEKIEAAFVVGCLYEICNEQVTKNQKKEQSTVCY